MYRRNGAHSIVERDQILDFSYFKRSEGNSFQFMMISEKKFSYKIKENLNALGIIMVISKFMSRSPKKEIQQFTELFEIRNCPRQFENFSHHLTLQKFLDIFQKRASSTSGLIEMITNYPIIYFILSCYARQVIKTQIEQKIDVLDLMGNEAQLLKNYEVQLRGVLLDILADAFDQQVCIKFFGSSQIQENYGQVSARMKIQISFEKEQWKWAITRDKNHDITPMIRSAHIIKAVRTPKILKSSTMLDTTDQVQSSNATISHHRSINKLETDNNHNHENLAKFRRNKNINFSDDSSYTSPRKLNRNWNYADPLNFNFIRLRNI